MATMNVIRDDEVYTIEIPSECPICHRLVVITQTPAIGVFTGFAEVVFRCPNPDCGRHFVGYFELGTEGASTFTRLIPNEPSPEDIPLIIGEVSPTFVEIYQQAKEAKDNELTQVCGPGYRKAFEFLIKDYAKSKTPSRDTQQAIEVAFAGKVVTDYIGDARIQAVAKRALWLGNDETHYLRKWTGKDIGDLITLIQLTMHWIEMEHLSEKYVSDMSDTCTGGRSPA